MVHEGFTDIDIVTDIVWYIGGQLIIGDTGQFALIEYPVTVQVLKALFTGDISVHRQAAICRTWVLGGQGCGTETCCSRADACGITTTTA